MYIFGSSSSGRSWTWIWLKGKLIKMDRRELYHSSSLISQLMRANINHMKNNGGKYVIRN